ncbi:MAG: esterase [Bacteroidales bacterium]|nr:esterase [Bacteroidales bacterium]
MKKYVFLTLAFCLQTIYINAQQAIWGGAPIVSPEINSDNSVSFRLQAPGATEVKISGEWMPFKNNAPGFEYMKNQDSVWVYTTGVLPSGLYSYYFTVDGMRCNDQNNVYQIRDVATIANIFIIGGGKGDLYSVQNVPHGSVSRRWYTSPTLNIDRRITIYTPPGYESSDEKYPVLYLLHGMGGDEEAWIALGRAAQILDNLIAQGKAKPMIVAMTNGNVDQQAAPGESALGLYKPIFRLPNTMNGKFEESFPDVIRFIESNYKVKSNKENRAIVGLSMGGFHSLHISRYFPETFGYIGLFSAAIKPFGEVKSTVYDSFDETLKTQKDNGYKLYWIGMGKTDFLYKPGEEYRAKLDSLGMKYTYVETEGGHTWANWRHYLSEFVPLLFK